MHFSALPNPNASLETTTRELISGDDWRLAEPALRVLRPNLPDSFLADREQMMREGYRLLGVDKSGKLVAIASVIACPHPTLYRELQIHDMVTLDEERGKGYGSLLLSKIRSLAEELESGRIFVHSRNFRSESHAFYRKNGFEDYSQRFIINR